jgi:hypothetical protein
MFPFFILTFDAAMFPFFIPTFDVWCDRVLALAGNSEAVRGGVLPRQPIELAATFNDEQPPKLNEFSPTGFECPRCGAAYGLYIGKDCLDISEIKCLHCDYLRTIVDCPRCGACHGLYTTKDYLGRQIIKCLHCWYSRPKHYPGRILLEAEESPIYRPETQDGIEYAVKDLLDAEADQNPILTNITFSPGFLACYSPSQSENIHYQTDADGQLSLLDFEVESVDEPPDPDDFECLNAFREAIALWDATHPELIEIGLDSFSEWALCPDDWYEPDTLLEPSEVLELSLTTESSSTCKFLIPVFDAWCDRTNGNSDEPLTAGVGARLLKPKLPSFPLMGIFAGDRVAEWKNFSGFVGNPIAERKNFSGFVGNPIAERKNFSGFVGNRVAERKNFSGFVGNCVSERKNFSGFMFSAAGDRTNGNFDEPLTAGVGARLSKLKPSSFPLMAIVVGDCSNIKKFARSSTLFSGRAPPGGDV